MAPPVWVLSVDLQTKTATFQSGMADAARSARGAFTDIKSGAGEMGKDVGGSMTEARHGVMLLGEEFGVHLPRALTSFIAGIGPVGAAMEAAFPFLAIIVGATLLIEHLEKVKEAGEKLTLDQLNFGTVANNVFNALDEKILQAQIRTDELNKNHMAALLDELQLINKQSLSELSHAFDELAKGADVTFKGLESHWYTFGIGSAGAKHALTDFKAEYESLLAQGKDKEASDLLAGTLKSAERVRDMQKQYAANQADTKTGKGATGQDADYNKFEEAALALKTAGVGVTKEEVQSQNALVEALRDQLSVEARVSDLKNRQGGNAKHAADNAITADGYKALKAQFDAERAEQEQEDKEREEARNRAIANIQEGEKQKIDATQQGSAARLAAIDAAIKEENNKGLQETSFYRTLLNDRINLVRQMSEEEAKIKAEAAKEAAEHEEKMGEIELAAKQEQLKLAQSTRRVSAQEQVADEIAAANEEFNIKKAALDKEMAALDQHSKEYENKLKALQDKETELTQQHENQITQIMDKAQQDQNQKLMSGMARMEDMFASGLTNVIMRHQSFAAMMDNIGAQVVSGMLKNAIMSMMTMDMGKEKEAAEAARQMFIAGTHFPFPANIVMAPAMGAMAFASMMAFAEGGTVPGIGLGDTVPAMLTPGEHVADKGLTEGLRGMVKNGANGGQHIHIHGVRFAPEIHAVDADGVDAVLEKHQAVFQKHLESSLRKMNR
jgi:hypothetical protein